MLAIYPTRRVLALPRYTHGYKKVTWLYPQVLKTDPVLPAIIFGWVGLVKVSTRVDPRVSKKKKKKTNKLQQVGVEPATSCLLSRIHTA